MSSLKLGCCIPGASFMPEGIASVKDETLSELRDGCHTIIDAGFDYAEVGVGMIMRLNDDDFEAAVCDCMPLRAANSFIPPELKIVANDALSVGSPLMDYLEKAFYRMSRLGIEIVVFGSGGARRIPDGMSREDGLEYIKKFLTVCGKLGDKYNVTVAIEPLRALECNAVNFTFEGERLADAVSHPRVAYLADAFHMAEGGEPADALEHAHSLPVHIHVSEAPDRSCPGCHGGEYLTAFAKSLLSTDYDGMVSVECGFKDFRAELPDAFDFMNRNFRK